MKIFLSDPHFFWGAFVIVGESERWTRQMVSHLEIVEKVLLK